MYDKFLLDYSKIKRIFKKHKVKFIINDNYNLAKDKADATCNSLTDHQKGKNLRIKLGVTVMTENFKKCCKNKADYLAFGSFFKSKLKPNAKKQN